MSGELSPTTARLNTLAQRCDEHPFRGRSVSVVNDLSTEEQLFLYEAARKLKQAVQNGESHTDFQLSDSDIAVYLIFMENSTRTKESFRNAASYHGCKVNVFDCATSSFQKKETITDTIKMLCGYSVGQSLFVVRSNLEGTCRWLADAMAEHNRCNDIPRSSFINAGDGRHEHPTQEFLDEFSFLEHKNWDRSSIHLALIGDLFHGRTVHSKVDGLKIFAKVEVDLVAPAEIGMPPEYVSRMEALGYTVRKFESIDEYLTGDHVAPIWYFTRLQLERMGERVLDRLEALRNSVCFRRDQQSKLPPNTRFYHPLPRNAECPTIPFWLDDTPLNGWDRQSQNGYYTRIVLLGMLGGKLGADFKGRRTPQSVTTATPQVKFHTDNWGAPNFVEQVVAPFALGGLGGGKPETSGGYGAGAAQDKIECDDGIVVDNVGRGSPVVKIWDQLYRIRRILSWNVIGSHAVHQGDQNFGRIVLPNVEISFLDGKTVKKLAAMAPETELKVIKGGKVVSRYRLHMPPRIYNFPNIVCRNKACISNPTSMQREVVPYFERAPGAPPKSKEDADEVAKRYLLLCRYCERPHEFSEIWTMQDL
mmetsp:Transcript_48471/g.103696  ORF Transcript_48471/g.103696 Transcript_48471/m.103696 type:complete len:590 (-) Transcript_48471:95-1864(-)